MATDVKLPGSLQGRVTGKVDEILYLTMKRSEDAQGSERGIQNRVLVCQPTDHPKYGQIRAGDRSGQLPAHIVNPTFNDLKVAKIFKPGLFDGKGDVQDARPAHPAPEPQASPEFTPDPEPAAEFDTEMDELFGATKAPRTGKAAKAVAA
jgi:hypothetical protein